MPDLIAHLLRRAGFDTTPDEFAHYHALGFEDAVEELVDYEKVPDDFEQQHTDDLFERTDLAKLQLLWVNRMLTTPRPLQEKMTLFWHGLFATANYKVANPEWMWRQNELFRKNALGNFRSILTGVAKDPAMLKWLDGDQNRKGEPNENFGREVMELFTLGIGNYTEQDVKEGARALTGWQVTRLGDVVFNPKLHDDGVKTYLGYYGNFGLDDVVNIILRQPAHSQYLTRQLFSFFVNNNPSKDTIARLANVYSSSGNDVHALVRAIFLSPEFQAKESYRALIKSPVELVIGTFKKLGIADAPKATPALLRQMGQDLFNPPNVSGWVGGPAWISTGTMLDRFNFANLLARGRNSVTEHWLSPVEDLVHRGITAADLVDYLSKNVLHGDLTDEVTQVLVGYLQPGSSAAGKAQQVSPQAIDTRVRAVLHLMLSTPLHQLN